MFVCFILQQHPVRLCWSHYEILLQIRRQDVFSMDFSMIMPVAQHLPIYRIMSTWFTRPLTKVNMRFSNHILLYM